MHRTVNTTSQKQTLQRMTMRLGCPQVVVGTLSLVDDFVFFPDAHSLTREAGELRRKDMIWLVVVEAAL
jgi:hypothetical protein